MKKINIIILSILILGVVYRLFISHNGNFIFNMDNARDMIDVREMVISGNPRLIGPTTSIDGVYFGPLWYYMLAVPFLLSGGNPYASILMEILLWAIGGYFLLTLVNKYYGKLALFSVSLIWIASNFILLGSQYAFNPNPILFLTPVFIFCLLKFIETERLWYSLICWFLAGLFFHFSVPVGIFMPIVYILSLVILKKNLLKKKSQIAGFAVFILTFLPQLIFDLRHNFFMLKNLLAYQSTSHGNVNGSLQMRASSIFGSFYDTLLPTFMNFTLFTKSFIGALFVILIMRIESRKKLDSLTIVSLLLVFVPLIGLIPLKVDILRWYLNETMVASIFLVGFVIYALQKLQFGKWLAYVLAAALFVFTIQNASNYIQAAVKGDPGNSILKNEMAAVDLVYQKAGGKNFKVYTYLPSVYDFPYQYLFWWHGLNKYGYLPEEYAYLPGKPQYVTGKDKISGGNHPESSGLVFLIKEPDQINQRHLWENSFKDLELIDSTQVGSVEIEIRRESPTPSK